MIDVSADIAVASAEAALEAERRLLAGGFHDPAALWNASARNALSDAVFYDPNHAAVYRVLLGAASIGSKPSLNELRAVSESEGAIWLDAGYPIDLEQIIWSECSAENVNDHARIVADCHRRRTKARALIKEAETVLGGLDLEKSEQRTRRHGQRRQRREALPTRPIRERRVPIARH